jgi:hypothetical protein
VIIAIHMLPQLIASELDPLALGITGAREAITLEASTKLVASATLGAQSKDLPKWRVGRRNLLRASRLGSQDLETSRQGVVPRG